VKLNKTNILLLIIIIVGTILRFYNIFNLHFTNDELSALNRTRFDNFSDLINIGVMPDGHPALIQVFMYFYTKLFGFGDFITKLPFLLMGVASIYLSFKVSSRFFTNTSGLITASFIAVLQYTVMYSQIARPYSSGLFFVLLSVYFLQNFILNNKIKNTSIIWFIIASTLSAYNHYFSLLTILLISIFGIFLVKKENLKTYILSGLAIILLFLPHIQISLHQLSLGGLSWLNKPTPNSILMYFGYTFNYCWLLFFVTDIILLASFVFNNGFKTLKYSAFSLLIFVLPIIIGYAYSVNISPILQFSILIFSFPFLLMFISSFIKELSFKLNATIVSTILILGILSLSILRKHYTITYKSSFYSVAKNLSNDIKKYGTNNISEVFTLNGNFYVNKYLNEFDIDTTKLKANYQISEFNFLEFKDFLNNSKTNYFALGSMAGIRDLYLLDIIKQKYPYIINTSDSYFLFSKTNETAIINTNIIDTVYTNKLSFTNNNQWEFDNNKVFTDTITSKKYYYYNTDEWGISIKLDLDSILSNKNNIIVVKAVVKSENKNANILLVSEIINKDNLLHWDSSDALDFTNNTTELTSVYNSKILQDLNIGNNTISKIYLWNKNKNKIKVYSIEIVILKGLENPYGRLMPLE